MAFCRSTILKSARRGPTISLFAAFYKMTEKNWRGKFFISWPLYASNICYRILGFVLLWCLVGEGTCFSLFSSGTAGSIFHLHTCAELALCKCTELRKIVCITFIIREVEILSRINLP